MKHCLLGIDLGTTGCKSMIFDENLSILGNAYIEYPLINISANKIEQDAEEWWELTKKVIKKSLKQAGIKPELVKGISVSSQGIAFVPVDRDSNPLRNAFSWLDTRAKKQTTRILNLLDEDDVFNITGKRINASYVLPKLLWLKEHEPEVYKNTHKFLMGHDYIIARLCGQFVTDHTMASGTLIYDIKNQDWSREIVQKFDLDINKLPEIKWSGTPIGRITDKVARELDLSKETIVAVGGQDQKCAALGAGIKLGVATVSLGTASAIETKWDKPVIDKRKRIPCFTDLIRGKWITEGVIGAAGASLRWLKETLFSDNSYKQLDDLVKKHENEKNELFFYPHLGGASSPYWFEDAKGLFYGITLSTGTSEIVRSVFEGIAFQIKSNLDVMEELTGNVEELRVFGGGSKSDIWCQIISDITNKKVVTLYTSETANLGVAILAGVGAGVFKDTKDNSILPVIDKEYYPKDGKVNMYQKQYKEYLELQKKVFS